MFKCYSLLAENAMFNMIWVHQYYMAQTNICSQTDIKHIKELAYRKTPKVQNVLHLNIIRSNRALLVHRLFPALPEAVGETTQRTFMHVLIHERNMFYIVHDVDS